MSGHSSKSSSITWLRIEPPSLISVDPKFILAKTKPSSSLIIGVIDLFTSLIGANAEIINDSGLVFLQSFHWVSIERESLPTGIVKFHVLQISWLIVFTVSKRFEFASRLFGLAIQLAESFIEERLVTPLEIKFRTASVIANLPAAWGFISATGDFSPIAIASPVFSP